MCIFHIFSYINTSILFLIIAALFLFQAPLISVIFVLTSLFALIGHLGVYRGLLHFFQRGIRGYSDLDVWALHDYLCEWHPKAFRKLGKDTNGCCDELYDASRKEDECWKWREVLEKIAEGFEAEATLDQKIFFYSLGSAGEEEKKANEANRKLLEKRAKEGWKLFQKYFHHLWD